MHQASKSILFILFKFNLAFFGRGELGNAHTDGSNVVTSDSWQGHKAGRQHSLRVILLIVHISLKIKDQALGSQEKSEGK